METKCELINHSDTVSEITSVAAELIKNWTKQEAGDINNWFSLMENLVKIIEDKYYQKLSGIEKADCATKAIIELAKKVYNKFTENLSEEEIETLKNGELKIISVIIENPVILQASTGFFKRLLNYIDKDKDGEISMDECRGFWCCGNINACKKQKK